MKTNVVRVHKIHTSRLLEGNETGRVGGTNTGTTVLDGLVGDARKILSLTYDIAKYV
jgi:hypothetical protein